MVSHLEKVVCPPGTRVWPVQNDSWLEACIDCGIKGKIYVRRSKTDYIVLIEEAWNYLNSLTRKGVQVTGEHLTEQLKLVIALYEVWRGGGATIHLLYATRLIVIMWPFASAMDRGPHANTPAVSHAHSYQRNT